MEQNLQHIRERLASSQQPSCSSDEALTIEAIPRVHHNDLGHARFVAEFANTRVPVIIEGFEDGLAYPYWSIGARSRVSNRFLCSSLELGTV